MTNFLILPAEVRFEIYKLFLDSIVLHIPEHPHNHGNETALLRVSRVIHNETKALWFQHLTFRFENPRSMLNMIGTLPVGDRGLIRHIELVPTLSKVYLPLAGSHGEFVEGEAYKCKYQVKGIFIDVFDALESMQDLQLESLIIDYRWTKPPYSRRPATWCLRRLVHFANGWKMAHIIYPGSQRLRGGPCWQEVTNTRKPITNEALNDLLQKKNGEHCGAYVKILQKPGDTDRDFLLDFGALRQALVDDATNDYGEKQKSLSEVMCHDCTKEVVIAVKRGAHVCYDLNPNRVFGKFRSLVERLLDLDIDAEKMDWNCILLAEKTFQRIKNHR